MWRKENSHCYFMWLQVLSINNFRKSRIMKWGMKVSGEHSRREDRKRGLKWVKTGTNELISERKEGWPLIKCAAIFFKATGWSSHTSVLTQRQCHTYWHAREILKLYSYMSGPLGKIIGDKCGIKYYSMQKCPHNDTEYGQSISSHVREKSILISRLTS